MIRSNHAVARASVALALLIAAGSGFAQNQPPTAPRTKPPPLGNEEGFFKPGELQSAPPSPIQQVPAATPFQQVPAATPAYGDQMTTNIEEAEARRLRRLMRAEADADRSEAEARRAREEIRRMVPGSLP